MKKVLAVLMAVLMFVGMFSMAASAVSYQGYDVQPNEVLILLHFNACTSRDAIEIFNLQTCDYELIDQATGTVALKVPAGGSYNLPVAVAPDGKAFSGWLCTGTNESYGTGSRTTTSADGGTIIQYQCETTVAEAKPATIETVKTILVKIFGIIIGLFYGDTDYGQELVAKIFDSVFGSI